MQDKRKPDLSGPDYEELEKKVKDLLDPDQEPKKPDPAGPKKDEVKHDDGDEGLVDDKAASEAATAPPISKKIDIDHQTDEADATSEAPLDDASDDTESEESEELSPEQSESEAVAAETESAESDETQSTEAEAEPEPEPEESQEEDPEADKEEAPVEPEKKPEEFDDHDTEKAVNDIVATEGDNLIAAEDEKLEEAFKDKPPTFRQKLKNFFAAWWHNKKARWATIVGLIILLLATALIPTTRYAVLNSFGVRSSTSITVLDESTQQPLNNVAVQVGTISAQTDDSGVAKLQNLKLGKATLVVQKTAFAQTQKSVTLGWGSNPLGSIKLKPVGVQYDFIIKDYLSGKPIQKVEASSGEASAFSDDEGRVKLTVEKNADADLEVLFNKDNLREEKTTVPTGSKAVPQVVMVSDRPHVFISKRSGKYAVYKIDIDGKNEKLILAGTGNEKDDMVLVPHPTENIAALVSTRDNKRNSDGFLLSTLTLIDLSDDTTSSVTQSERVQIVDWADDQLIYVQIAAGTSAGNPKRHRLISYDYKQESSKEIAASNYFNDVTFALGKLYYAPSSTYQTDASASFIRVNPDGSGKQTVLGKEVWNAFRTSYDHLILSQDQNWYDLQLSSNKAAKLDGAPANITNRLYIDSPDEKHSLWVDSRDGKGVLLAYNVSEKKDEILRTQSGLTYPARWLNDKTVIYRISTQQETADYVLSLDGGEPRKIRDVSATGGIDTWYYY